MIAVIDYGAGNIFSIKNALDYLGVKSVLTGRAEDINNADALILPGVGAFPAAMEKLGGSGLIETVKDNAQKKPFLGICLGMQLLFDRSSEFFETDGLSLIPGAVEKFEFSPEQNLCVPHMGWNKLTVGNECPLSAGIDGEYVYFVHSYLADCADENISAHCEYGGKKVPALVFNGENIFGAQFHPEKSGNAGLKILRNFISLQG